MFKITTLFFIIFISTFSSNKYKPKNIQEKITLNKYKHKILTVGLSDADLFQSKTNGQSLNLIIKDLLENYLDLKIKVKIDDWDDLYKEYKNNKIDILGNLTHSLKRTDHSVFSYPLFDQSLYIASNKIKLQNLEDLSNKNIYTVKDSIYNNYLNGLVSNKNININLISTNNKMNFKNQLILGPEKEIEKLKYKIKLISLPGLSIGLHKKYNDLLPIINNALNEKYLKEISNLFKEKKNNIYKENFYNSLTLDEKIYLKKLKPLNFAYEADQNIVYYSKEFNQYIGFIPLIIKEIQERSSIRFNIVNNNFKNLNEIYNAFLEEKVDILPLAKNKERNNLFEFTNQVDSVNLFEITNYKYDIKKIGVIQNSIEESIAQNYFLKNNIVLYNNYENLKKDLISHKIMSGFLFSREGLSSDKFKIKKMMEIPIYFSVHKDDIILKNILNKAIIHLLNLKDIKEKAKEDINYERFLKNENNKDKNKILLYLWSITSILFIIALFKIIFHKKMVKRLKKDPLTGLKNRIEFNSFNFNDIDLKGYAISIDINNLKDFNDKYGHIAGDNLILKISNFLKNTFNENYTFRITGDSFYIYLDNNNILFHLDKLIDHIRKFKKISGYFIHLNIGYFHIKNNETSLEKAFNYADMAMYESKKNLSLYYLEATDLLIKKKEREYTIKNLLREEKINEIFPVYQPKFSIKNNEIIGGEALARWITTDLGFISPAEFIPIAEKIKQIYLIDYKIAEETIKTIKKWKDLNLINKNFKLSFNISMETFEREDIVNTLTTLLDKYNISGEYIEIEITESILSSNLNKTLEKLKLIKNLNIQISIDDFTAGHSTATLLTCLPIDIVKFDKSILDIIVESNSYNHSIYKNLISLVKDLNLKIVAEGIETEYQLKFLKDNNIDIGQGYLFSKPIPSIDFENLLQKKRDE
ncbi:EAL domain-containing protein [uncultured Cetobacterium sp.]|uniref:EAL domain-containing protein n=1 Tax=uncultured Cetobacterium sp. TaxID=527638 RepID=UPI00260DEBD6|nr:EAL domain-containing protein [uncultured Cetobacterium sp.]